LNRSQLVLFSLFFITGPGSSREHQKCSTWLGKCVRCIKKRSWTQGVFCANYYWSVGGFTPCHQMWCGECYTLDPTVIFYVNWAWKVRGDKMKKTHRTNSRRCGEQAPVTKRISVMWGTGELAYR
jgi:hypothetical protein